MTFGIGAEGIGRLPVVAERLPGQSGEELRLVRRLAARVALAEVAEHVERRLRLAALEQRPPECQARGGVEIGVFGTQQGAHQASCARAVTALEQPLGAREALSGIERFGRRLGAGRGCGRHGKRWLTLSGQLDPAPVSTPGPVDTRQDDEHQQEME
ncbi:hypothetical protein HRbin26_01145 [bacterium HR26]|nr:hypothetical protein HRbin26_01145 [bacterium HR26]